MDKIKKKQIVSTIMVNESFTQLALTTDKNQEFTIPDPVERLPGEHICEAAWRVLNNVGLSDQEHFYQFHEANTDQLQEGFHHSYFITVFQNNQTQMNIPIEWHPIESSKQWLPTEGFQSLLELSKL